ncbi:Cobalt-zinc-cadmium resistance protein CzcC precursor [Botrimarina colliarenosi]|uniref:Cobalt-zinc-cadmium resistance protein CzcC n=1 Tax=Botrimarina colliarenosi TaxID=2528001 RepID=A0A5C6AI42_9BACT|nr:TolC family protein [Botrimarina colliarenosi]TWT99664.1 Cobalt-zinc-cadmium resistance protein CzcC precursor [Botrimarina colliarenosi]
MVSIRSILLVLVCAAAASTRGQEPLLEPTSVRALPAVMTFPDDLTPDMTGANVLTLADAESRALSISPSLAALRAEVTAARWECVQAGLPPNPTGGYLASEVGNDGRAGQQGAYLGQQFIRGGKLDYAQSVAAREARVREQLYDVERLRLLTDVRTVFVDTYLSQLEIELADQLLGLSLKGVDTSNKLIEAGEGRRTDVLQAEIESQRAGASKRQATVRRDAGWRRLAALTGLPAETPQVVDADLTALLGQTDWQASASRLIAASPAIAARVAEIERARCNIALQKSQAVADVTAQVSVQYDDSTDDTVAGVQIGVPLMLWNRNQGGVGRAQAELVAAHRRLESTEQTLHRQLADAFGRYERAKTQAETLASEVLPRAKESLGLSTEGYAAGEVSYLELLTVQRTYFQVSLERLALLREMNEMSQLIEGRLLSGSGQLD